MEAWQSYVVLALLIVLALAGALRWDALRARWRDLLTPRVSDSPPPEHVQPRAPQRLHDAELAHQAPAQKPHFHRSGKRG